MFEPLQFREKRIDVMHDLIKKHPFATLVTMGNAGLSADHLPLVLHPECSKNGFLRGHVSAGNPLCKTTQDTIDVLVTFQGPHAYVSPSWYPSKAEHGKVVPTWNYVVVHAHGTLSFRKNSKWLMAHLEKLTGGQESTRPSPWLVSDAPDEFVARQLKGLVGIEIEIQSLQGKWKVSQNKNEQDRSGVEAGLRLEGLAQASALAELIK